MAAEISRGTPVRFAILALLAAAPAHGYELKLRFERAVGGIWPLNVGQVYDTLRRLERDGLVEPHAGDGEDERRPFAATDKGRVIAEAWLAATPIDEPPPRDELAIKLLIAADAEIARPADEFAALVQRQRASTMATLQRLARRQAALAPDALAELTLLDLLMLRTEADARWLDQLEARLAHAREGDIR
jgi:DNA-binding PadR family transcriptional regulator